jgi:hypothetical protein
MLQTFKKLLPFFMSDEPPSIRCLFPRIVNYLNILDWANSVFDGDVVKSDTAIPSALKDALNNAVATLEDVLDMHRDWHPGSNEQVLDLAHPSLFPVVYGRTRVLPNSLVGLDDCITSCGKGLTLDVPPKEECALRVQRTFENKSPYTDYLLKNPFNQKSQWLPCEVPFSENDEVK